MFSAGFDQKEDLLSDGRLAAFSKGTIREELASIAQVLCDLGGKSGFKPICHHLGWEARLQNDKASELLVPPTAPPPAVLDLAEGDGALVKSPSKWEEWQLSTAQRMQGARGREGCELCWVMGVGGRN